MIPDLPFVYIAGAFNGPTFAAIQENIRRAQLWAAAINRTGWVFAVLPHNASIGLEGSLDRSGWVGFTLELSRRCEGLIMLPRWSESDGSVGEWTAARDEGRPWVAATTLDGVKDTVKALLAEIAQVRTSAIKRFVDQVRR